jgi:hypothetical protein
MGQDCREWMLMLVDLHAFAVVVRGILPNRLDTCNCVKTIYLNLNIRTNRRGRDEN